MFSLVAITVRYDEPHNERCRHPSRRKAPTVWNVKRFWQQVKDDWGDYAHRHPHHRVAPILKLLQHLLDRYQSLCTESHGKYRRSYQNAVPAPHPRDWYAGKCDKLSFLRGCLSQMDKVLGGTNGYAPLLEGGNPDPLRKLFFESAAVRHPPIKPFRQCAWAREESNSAIVACGGWGVWRSVPARYVIAAALKSSTSISWARSLACHRS